MTKSKSRLPLRVMPHLPFFLFCLIVIAPTIWLVLSSFKSSFEVFLNVWGLPERLRWENYSSAWFGSNLGRYFLNSVGLTLFSVAAILVVSAMATYALTRIQFPWKHWLLWLFVSGLMIPTVLVVIPLFNLMQKLNLLDSHLGLFLIYVAYSLPFSIFALTPFFQAVPEELEEAAIIDGCGVYSLFYCVTLPLTKPGLIIVLIFNVFGIWNEYVLAFSVICSDRLRTLPVGIASLVTTQQYQSDWGALFAGLVIAIVPVVVVYAIFQRQLSEGIMAGAIKG